jgi:hypothetical protein
MTNASAAALRISSEVLGDNMPWAKTLGSRVSKPASAAKAVQANLVVGAAAAKGWVGAELRPLSETIGGRFRPAGQVGRWASMPGSRSAQARSWSNPAAAGATPLGRPPLAGTPNAVTG